MGIRGHPNWDRTQGCELPEDSEDTGSFIATTKERLELVPFLFKHMYDVKWLGPVERHGEWQPEYWKTLPQGFHRPARMTKGPPVEIRTPAEFEESKAQHAQWVELTTWIEYGFVGGCKRIADEKSFSELR